MANRFDPENRGPAISEDAYRLISFLIFIAIIVLFIEAVRYTGTSSIENQQDSLESAIARDIVQCYSIEGTYPPSLQYMEDHYGLTYDKDIFFIDYQPIGANIYPDYTIIRR